MALVYSNICECISDHFKDRVRSLWYFERGINDIMLFIIVNKSEEFEYVKDNLMKLDRCETNIEAIILDRELELFNIEGAKRII